MKNSKTWIGVIFCIVIGLVLLIPAWKDYRNLKTAPDISSLEVSDYKDGLMVRGHADMVFACYCAQYDDSDNEVFRWYLVPAKDDMTALYLGIKVNSKLYESYDMIYDSTWDYLEGQTDSLTKTISFQGRLKKVDGDVETYLDKFINTYGTEPEYFVRYYVELKTTKGSFGLMIAGIVFIAIGIIMIVLGIFTEKRGKLAETERQDAVAQTPWANGFSLVLDDKELDRMAGSHLPVAQTDYQTGNGYGNTNAGVVDEPAPSDYSSGKADEPVSSDLASAEEKPSPEGEPEDASEEEPRDSDNNDIFVL